MNQLYRYIYICIFSPFWIFIPFMLPQSSELSYLCYTVCSHLLPILHILSIVYMCQSQPPHSSHPAFPLGIHIFVLYICISLFLICK